MTTIPPITDPLGKHWNQPKLSEIDVHDNIALMTKKTFNNLAEYSYSNPTGTYIGKMWRRRIIYSRLVARDYLVWYDVHSSPDTLSIHYRKIVLI